MGAVIVGYTRVSSEEQGRDGYGLDAQAQAIVKACIGRGWEPPAVVREVASGSKDDRPILAQAVQDVQVASGTLIVARLDRLSRSVGHFAGLLDRSQKEGWQLVILDPNVDTTTAYGRAMAGMAAVFAQLERELISQRTKEGLAVARAKGRLVRVGKLSPAQRAEVHALAAAGASQNELARMYGVNQSSISRMLRQDAQASKP